MEIAAIVGHTSPEMIMKNYAGFIKDNHLKIDTDISLYSTSNNKMGNTKEIESFKKA